MNFHTKILFQQLASYNVTRAENISTKFFDDRGFFYVGDDGGYCFFSCELPITRKGEIIDIGFWYELSNFEALLVTGKKLVKRGNEFIWYFEGEAYESNGEFSSEELLMVYEFKRLIKHGSELVEALKNIYSVHEELVRQVAVDYLKENTLERYYWSDKEGNSISSSPPASDRTSYERNIYNIFRIKSSKVLETNWLPENCLLAVKVHCEVMVLDYVHEPFEEEKFCGGTPRDESFIVIAKKNGSDFDPRFEARNYFTEDEWESTS